MRKSYKFKLYRSKKNKYLYDRINISGIIYNHCIALHKRYYRLFKKSLSSYKLQEHLAKLRNTKYTFWKKVPAQSVQDIAQRIDKAYKLFFSNQKKKIKSSLPGFKVVKKYKSFTMKTANWNVKGNIIRICDKTFKFSKSREIKGVIKTVTVKRDSLGDIYLFFSVIENKPEPTFTSGKSIGIDFGLKTFLTTSEGYEELSPEFFKENRKIIALASRKVSSKNNKKSKNRAKSVKRLAIAYKTITNKREDYFFKLAKTLCEQNDYIYIEDLNLKGMQKLWGRKISDLAFSSFVEILESQGEKYGCVVHKIDRFFPSSKTCFDCGYINKNLNLKDRNWTCECGVNHERDINAAKNILKVGASTFGGDSVRPRDDLG